MRLSAGGAMVAGLGFSLGGCSAAAEAAVFNPAVDTWLWDLAQSIAATQLTNFLNNGISKLAGYWREWYDGVTNQVQDYQVVWNDCYGHTIPPVVLAQVSNNKSELNNDGDPMRDGLVACVDSGEKAVYFDPWAWQALSMYVHEMTSGLSGQNLANAQRVCVSGLIPSGTRPKSGQSPENVVEWMTYDTRSGPVEIGKLLGADGNYLATVKATGIWDADQQPLVKQYKLPTASA